MFQYISLGLIAVTALIVLANLLMGVLRGLKKTIGSLVAIVASALLAFIVTIIICNPTSSVVASVMTAITDALATGEMQDIFGIVEIGEALTYYVAMLMAPFVFMALYAIISVILTIVAAIVIKFIPPFTYIV